MRTPEQIFNLIKKVALEDENILAVYYGGSRANPNVEADIYQDFDVVFVVEDVSKYTKDYSFVEKFGEILLMQQPYLMDAKAGKIPFDFSKIYNYLTIFKDGNRMDITLKTLEEAKNELKVDMMNVLLLDKGNYLGKIDSPTDKDFHHMIPHQDQFDNCINEFFWCLNNVAKAIKRDELTYAHNMYNIYVKKQYYIMLDWMIAVRYDEKISSGKFGKFYNKLLSVEEYELLEKSFPGVDYESFWIAIEYLIELFVYAAKYITRHTDLEYIDKDEEGLREYIHMIKNNELDT